VNSDFVTGFLVLCVFKVRDNGLFLCAPQDEPLSEKIQ